MTHDVDSSPALHATCTTLDPLRPLAGDVLAAIVYGRGTPCPFDPRCLRIDLEPQAGGATCETWCGRGPVRCGTSGAIHYVENGDCLFGWIDLDEAEFGGLVGAAENAYRDLLAFHAAADYRHVWRIWNFITAINDGDGDEERYKLFSLGRAHGFIAAQAQVPVVGYPAATAVGKPDGPRTLQVCWLAGREPGVMLENPRQVAAYQYPRRYGPAAPAFSRAMLIPGPTLLISGTASIVGHASLHDGNLVAQIDETLANLDVLLRRAQAAGHLASSRLGPGGLLKVYLRPGIDPAPVTARLRERLGTDTPLIVVAAEICRRELLIEIEAVQRT